MKSVKSIVLVALTAALMFTRLPARAAEPDAESVKVAEKILEATHAASLGDQLMGQMMKAFSTGLTQSNPGRAKDVEDILNQVIVPEFHDAMPQLMAMAAKTYASNLSLDELKHILAFYQSEAGKIYVAKLPDIVRQQGVNGQAIAQQIVAQIQEKMAKALEAKGLKKPQGI